jgi:hypothetical protein
MNEVEDRNGTNERTGETGAEMMNGRERKEDLQAFLSLKSSVPLGLPFAQIWNA